MYELIQISENTYYVQSPAKIRFEENLLLWETIS